MSVRKDTKQEYASNFYMSKAAFLEEAGLYQKGSDSQGGELAQFVPKVCLRIVSYRNVFHCTYPVQNI